MYAVVEKKEKGMELLFLFVLLVLEKCLCVFLSSVVSLGYMMCDDVVGNIRSATEFQPDVFFVVGWLISARVFVCRGHWPFR